MVQHNQIATRQTTQSAAGGLYEGRYGHAPGAEAPGCVPPPPAQEHVRRPYRLSYVCVAWVYMHAMSLLLALDGFDRAYRLATGGVVFRRPGTAASTQSATNADVSDIVLEVRRTIGIAKRWHLRSTVDDCLSVALTGVWMLRWYGIDGRLMLGVKGHPFSAHAWVKVRELIIDFPPDLYERYQAIDMGRNS